MKKWSVVIILSCAQFIMVLDSTVMNVSISEVVSDLHTSVSGLQAAITFYTLTMAALMLTGGKLGDILGRLKVFRIGSVIYAAGSLITALSPSLAFLMFGWSLVEGLGAVLVIPAIAALIAANYKGRDRILGYTLIGAASGVAVAAGPLIGGFMTTYLSWRYVFAAETVIMGIVLFFSGSMRKGTPATEKKVKLDYLSVLLSAAGLASLVLGILQSKTWGWVMPKGIPQISGHDIAPLGISLVAYLIVLGLVILRAFYKRQVFLKSRRRDPLLQVSMFSIKQLRAGISVLCAQYLIIAAIFFVIPIYLQMMLGYDALETGKRIFPLSVSIVIFSIIGSRLVTRFSPKQIVRIGQSSLLFGSIVLLYALNPEMKGLLFGSSMFIVGIGLGLLASQIGNINMSSVPEGQTNEVGGLQGTFQNLGSSLGTAIIGSVMISSLSTGFVSSVGANPSIPPNVQSAVASKSKEGIPIASAKEVEGYATSAGLSPQQASAISTDYKNSQLSSLKSSMFFLVLIAFFSMFLSRNIPDKSLIQKKN
jgi:EmrB/QacA subfamily drug resistance transporter